MRRFFNKSDDHSYQVNKRLREAVVFAPQNLIADAPFSKLDLISCRNLLIYLEPEIQKKIVSLFHFSLNAGGFLILGPSETVGRQADLFVPISARWRIYRRTGPTRRSLVEIPIHNIYEGRSWDKALDASPRIAPSLEEVMQKRLLADYAPASVLIGRKFEVLCFQGPTVDYLEFPSGEPTQDLLALARPGLRAKLRSLVAEATRTGRRRNRRQPPSETERRLRALSGHRKALPGAQGSRRAAAGRVRGQTGYAHDRPPACRVHPGIRRC